MEAIDAIEIGVVDLAGVCSAVDVDQREGGAGDFVLGRGTKSRDDAFRERGFAGAEIPGQKNQHGRPEPFGEFPAPLRGFFGGVGDDFRDPLFRHALAAPEGVGGVLVANSAALPCK